MFPGRGSIASNSVVINDDEMDGEGSKEVSLGEAYEPSGILILTPNSTLKLLTAGQVEGLDVHVFEDFDVACV